MDTGRGVAGSPAGPDAAEAPDGAAGAAVSPYAGAEALMEQGSHAAAADAYAALLATSPDDVRALLAPARRSPP